jgi:hypothetical protein|nr:MAG: hypothetical protein DIU52_10610 [bacterium]
MRRLTAVGLAVAVVILAACGARAVQLVAPAPDHRTALDCALNEANARGYIPEAGGVDAGHITVNRKVGGGTREEVVTRLMTLGLAGANSVELDRLVIVGADGDLRITAWAIREDGKADSPRKEAVTDAREILAKCARPEG